MRAVVKYVRISPQKVQKVINVVKGEPVEKVLDILTFMPQKAARIVAKAIRSAVANAEQHPDYDVDVDSLLVKNIVADQGPTSKRFRARARGRGARILKRTSHITVILAEETV
ncbi:50S ribosomal protein L22 [Desulfococcaceae bacterium HSG7]|nr:50S ribosomal protein L22 [Desulfococcaceae bacterium HSG7]